MNARVWVLVALSSCGVVSVTPDGGRPVADAGSSATVDAGQPDAGFDAGVDAGNLSRYWDGGACTRAEDCPCFSNDDCAPTFRCRSRDTTGVNIFCEPGPRGAGTFLTPCTLDTECASALCVDARDGGQRCSKLCDSVMQCMAPLAKCTYVGFGVDRSLCSP